MTRIVGLSDIVSTVRGLELIPALEEAFVAYSEGRAVVPPVGELIFRDPPGDVHIKYGTITNDRVFVIKVATGFYENPSAGLPGNSGLLLVFSTRTGMLQAVLLDEGYLTNVRTAVAGAITTKWLAPRTVQRIAVFGSGLQARMQVEAISKVVHCRRVTAWGRPGDPLEDYRRDMEGRGFEVTTTHDPGEAALGAQVIVTTTPAETPFLDAAHVSPGTHIVAMGSDTEFKNELTPALMARADIYVTDSLSQCSTRGELHHALKAGARTKETTVELGSVIKQPSLGRSSVEQITIADLTGVAVQDIAIAKAVCEALEPEAC